MFEEGNSVLPIITQVKSVQIEVNVQINKVLIDCKAVLKGNTNCTNYTN